MEQAVLEMCRCNVIPWVEADLGLFLVEVAGDGAACGCCMYVLYVCAVCMYSAVSLYALYVCMHVCMHCRCCMHGCR